jgi:beta-glucosidase
VHDHQSLGSDVSDSGAFDPAPLVGLLDLETKVSLLTGRTSFTLPDNDTIGLSVVSMSDGPTGVRGVDFSGGPTTALFPNATLLASTWSTSVLREVGALLAEEATRQGIHVVLGPTINLHRSPLGGRLFEAYSEDPLLTGLLAAAYIDGLQAARVGACPKHFVANEAETQRTTVNCRVDERTLREVYLLPFEIAVTEASPWVVMAAYNDINGVAATEHRHLNNEVLKGEWSWDGVLVSDWSATKTTAPAANGGLDLVMPGPVGPWGDALVREVQHGAVAEDVVDDHVGRVLRLAHRVGALGEQRTWPPVPDADSEIRRNQLTRIAASGMTVLHNSGALPLASTDRLAVIGRHAVNTVGLGGGSSQVRPPHVVSIAEGLRQRLEHVTISDGVTVRTRHRSARPGSLRDPVTGEPGTRVRVRTESGELVSDHLAEDNQCDVHGVDFPGANLRVELRAIVPAGRVTVGVVGVGAWTIVIGDVRRSTLLEPVTDDHAEAILRPPGEAFDVALTSESEVVAWVTAPLYEHAAFALVAEPTPQSDDESIAGAVAAATAADVAVVVVGLTEEQETESVDKTTLALPGRQDELIESVAAVARQTVVVVNAATPILMPWRDRVDAILLVGLPGQEGGHAVAAALVNDIEPSGRLVTTMPSADGATVAWDVTPTDGCLDYAEGTFIGYRGHAAGLAPAPAYWFGHGSGYGRFEYDAPTVDADSLTVSVLVTNVSEFASREVVQVYFDPLVAEQPVRLAGWSGVHLAPGERALVTVRCDRRMWRTWDARSGTWSILTGGELVIARGLGDVRARLPVR